jgi:hypothetical protein
LFRAALISGFIESRRGSELLKGVQLEEGRVEAVAQEMVSRH